MKELDDFVEELSSYFDQWLVINGLTVNKVADHMGWARDDVRKILSGDSTVSLHDAFKLAHMIGLDMELHVRHSWFNIEPTRYDKARRRLDE